MTDIFYGYFNLVFIFLILFLMFLILNNFVFLFFFYKLMLILADKILISFDDYLGDNRVLELSFLLFVNLASFIIFIFCQASNYLSSFPALDSLNWCSIFDEEILSIAIDNKLPH